MGIVDDRAAEAHPAECPCLHDGLVRDVIKDDIGKMMALSGLASLVISGEVPVERASTLAPAVLARVHAELGAETLIGWCLPLYLVDVCERHHAEDLPATPEHVLTHVVRVVAAIHALRSNVDGPFREAYQSMRALGLGLDTIRALDASLAAHETLISMAL